MKLKIMSFNTQHCLNFVTRKIDYDVMAEAIKKVDPDIVGLQEMRGAGFSKDYQDQIGILAYRLGMEGVFGEAVRFGGFNPYGIGLLTKLHIADSSVIKIPDPKPPKYNGYYETRCVLKTQIELPDNATINVSVSHFGLNPDEQENAVSTVLKFVPRENSIFMGDLNMTPDNAILEPMFTEFNDTKKFAKAPGDMLTFESPSPDRKIDYIFAGKDIKVLDSYVPEIIASDHRPIVCEIEV